MFSYAVAILLSALLLFQIQPIISKTLLPWFGGTSSVWSSAMLFFQVALTGGYAYANWLIRRDHKKQTLIHLALLAISVFLVIALWIIWPSPITPADSLRPPGLSHPLLQILWLLVISIGLPFFALATNSPLTQAWFSRRNPGKSPYWLYALSNIGSLAGLLAYPILVEPALSLRWQSRIWTAGYILFAILAGYHAFHSHRGVPAASVAENVKTAQEKSKASTPILWILLSACASLMLLAVTNQITQEVAAIPFLWVLPLAIYLLSFVLTFSNSRWYRRMTYLILLLLASVGWFFITFIPPQNFVIEIIIYSFLLFTVTMTCHGELYALRPQADRLTRFYLMVSIGGALGGIAVNLVAPFLFRGYWELPLGVAMIWALLGFFATKEIKGKNGLRAATLTITMASLSVIQLLLLVYFSFTGNLFVQRNFYGVVQVRQRAMDSGHTANRLVHGTIIHGFQYTESNLRDTPTTYYSHDSGIGLAITSHPKYGSGMRVGVLGLGVGTLAAYALPEDDYRFYEINPAVIDLAYGQGGYFSFLKDSKAVIKVIAGDARVSLENELNSGQMNQFDILVLDTFSSDAIPTHLLTRQAFDLYLKHLAPNGLIAAHITNERLDLRPVLWQISRAENLEFAVIENTVNVEDADSMQSTWVLLTRDKSLLEAPTLADRISPSIDFRTNARLWTDDYSNLIQLIK